MIPTLTAIGRARLQVLLAPEEWTAEERRALGVCDAPAEPPTPPAAESEAT